MLPLDYALRALTIFGAAAVLLTECLSLFHAVAPGPLLAGWGVVALCVWWRMPPFSWTRPRLDVPVALAVASITVILALTAFTAALSPPNSADAMAYHMPRVVYWAQNRSVEFFPTPYYNQVMLPPAAEYVMLHTYLLSGGDRWVNFVQWFGFAGCIVAVALIARELGLNARAQAFAALFCATLPGAILASSGAKNDLWLSLWIVAALCFALRGEWTWLGAAAGLALATKPTAFLFLPPLLAMALYRGRVWKQPVAALAAGALLLNGAQWTRNMRLAGSPLGFDSAQGDGVYRWRNDEFGWRPAASNLLRHLSEQLGARSPVWNERVFQSVLTAHRLLRINPNDPNTTWPNATYAPPRNANHEADANNRWHLLWIAFAALLLCRRREWVLYAAALAAGALLFCAYLKWQPFMARLEIPLFIAAAPLAARIRPQWILVPVALFFLSGAQRPALQNWTRPLRGPTSLFNISREQAYFNDMVQWHNIKTYLDAVESVASTGCRRVGLDIRRNQLEYPFMALLRARVPGVEFVHVPGAIPEPCATWCIDCQLGR